MRELFAKWARQRPEAVTVVTNLSPTADPENPSIDATSPLSPMSPRKGNDSVKTETDVSYGSVVAGSFRKHGDSGDIGDSLESLDNNCHQPTEVLVTTVTGWPDEALQEVQERTVRLMAGKWRQNQARIIAVHITADKMGLDWQRYPF